MEDNNARLALRRAFRKDSSTTVQDFETAAEERSVIRPALAALVISSLGVLGAGGIAMASAATSTDQAKTSLVTDKDAADNSKAAPQDFTLDANQKAAAQDTTTNGKSAGQDAGGLQQFGQRGTTPNRNAVRSALNSQLANTKGQQRTKSLEESQESVSSAQASSEAAEREKLMQADIARVNKNAARIKEEKRKAAEALRKLQEQARLNALKQKQAQNNNAPAPGADPTTEQTTTTDNGGDKDGSTRVNGKKVSADDVQSISNGGAALPLAPGSYSVGAYFGKTGSWSRYHTGQDFPAPTGTPVYAASSGIVGGDMSAAGWAGFAYVTIHHSGGGSTLYAHLSARVVSAGQAVRAGQLIGYVGNEGRSFGSHLHFEYYPAGTTPGDVYSAADPMAWLRSLGLNA